VDLILSEHIKAAKDLIKNSALLLELVAEINRDCEELRSYLFAAQVVLLVKEIFVFVTNSPDRL